MKAIPSLRKLQYVVVVAEELHFRRAAERLHVAQPALSRQIKEIESAIGFKILLRDGHFVQLTMAGKLFATGVKKLLDEFEIQFEETQRQASALGREHASEFILAHSPFAPLQLRLKAPVLQRHVFQTVTLRLRFIPTSALLTAITHEEVNAGVTFAPIEATNLAVISIGQDHWKALLPAAHKLSKARTAAISDFKGIPVISNGADQTHPTLFRRLIAECRARGFAYTPISQISSPTEAIDLVRAGVGTVFMPSGACGNLPGDLRAVRIEDISPLELVLVHRREEELFIPQLIKRLREVFVSRMAIEPLNQQKRSIVLPQRKTPTSISRPEDNSIARRTAV